MSSSDKIGPIYGLHAIDSTDFHDNARTTTIDLGKGVQLPWIYDLRIECVCGAVAEASTNITLTSNPPQYYVRCSHCDIRCLTCSDVWERHNRWLRKKNEFEYDGIRP
jgi:hypothetical protein